MNISRYPDTLLGNTDKLLEHFTENQYFFDTSRICFQSILDFYQSNGKLKCPPGLDVETFEAECRYFQLPHTAICEMLVDEGMMDTRFLDFSQSSLSFTN